MIILGIDPGSALTGVGVIDFDGKKIRALNYRAIRTDSKKKLPFRLKEIYDEVKKEIEVFHPEVCSVENVFGGKNIRSALIIGQARAAAMMAAINSGVEIAEYTPAEIKMSVVGGGRASKEQIQFMVRSILGLRENPRPLDCSDALAAAICHAHRMKFQGRVK